MSLIGQVASERDAEVRRKVDALAAVKPALRAYARAHGGHFILYGSAARGEIRFHSDVDLLVDFPKDADGDAWDFAESLCVSHGLKPDVMRRAWCKDSFVDHIMRDAEVIG